MSNHLGNKERFQVLMQQANIPAQVQQEHFHDASIKHVLCGTTENTWEIHVNKEQLISPDIYRAFYMKVQDAFSHIAKVSFVMHFQQVQTSEVIQTFWPLFVEWIQHKMPSINGWILKATIKAADDTLEVCLLDQTGLQLAKKKEMDKQIQFFYRQYFQLNIKVTFCVNESSEQHFEAFAEQIVQEERSATQEMMAAATEVVTTIESDEQEALSFGYEIKEAPVPIQTVLEPAKRVILQGTILKLEERELRTGNTLIQFLLTDFTDTMQCKIFVKNKDDLKQLKRLKDGTWVVARGKVDYDTFMNPPELSFMPMDVHEIKAPKPRMDEAEEKRVEFHLHTSMSAMDAVTSVKEYVKTAADWGHKAIAITDHGNLQSFPDAFHAAHKYGMKVIYGVEANVIDDAIPVVERPLEIDLKDAEYVVFDIETTGLSVTKSKIIEIGGVKMKGGKEIDRFSEFIDPHEKIPYHITQLTNITDDMVKGAQELKPVLEQFVAFAGDAVLVAHNARFDMGFMQANLKENGLSPFTNPVIDTLEFARLLFPTMKNHRLNTLSDKFKVSLDNHHRAIDDSIALGFILFHLIKEAEKQAMVTLSELNRDVGKNYKTARPFHCCIYAKDLVGKKNLYKLVSMSNTEYYHRVPRIPRSKLTEFREGLLVSSGCEKGELYEAVLNKSLEEAEQVAQFYDVLEVQPLTTYMHLVEKNLVRDLQHIKETHQTILDIGKKYNKPVIATGNVHYLNENDKLFRDITIFGITGFSPLKDQKKPDVHFRTTTEMLDEFSHLDKQTAYDIVVTNTNALADQFEDIELFPKKPFFPVIEGADEEIRQTCYATAEQIYGNPLSDVVVKRLEKELEPIIKYGFAALYLISEKLVKKSNDDGYLVGSRGSVGSSIVAMMLGISEVNPLPPHYTCSQCKHSEWFTDGSVASGFDLDNKDCPTCGHALKGEGQDIPFETFLGFKGDKVPDIDLNFSGDYQPHAHNYTKVLFGEKNVYRAGTIGTVADKTAFGFVKKYAEEKAKTWRTAEVVRLSTGCTGVKRSSGQHPGGIVVVPDYIEVEDITPIQFPADDTTSEWKTTHFDYHAFDANLLKLDILGHDDPTMMRMLYDLTDVNPLSIPMNDPKVMSIFSSTKALDVTPEKIRTPVATYGIPEMGTKFVRQMLDEAKPTSFSDLLQISGLSHGTGVWLGNAQELIKNKTCTIKTVIGCRDDIMLYLIYKGGMEAGLAFKITESVRKGKGLTDEWIQMMKEHNIPNWYINSCLKIEYMFPKAHASAYVISAVRTAFYKVYHPISFYAAYFSIRAEDFEIELLCQGYDAILKRLKEIEEKGFQALPKEKAMISVLEMALEMTSRGFSFQSIDLYRSQARKFLIDGDSLIPPFSAIPGVGINAAHNIAEASQEGDFLSIEDFRKRTKASKTVIEILQSLGCFRGLPETNQLSLF
ncbi:PolC-type DNA polymerase III [Longirhabdus pacifica]|uniref:PolC-type DNA polymerase III n=1 Tax=Longirhabdus pacifica TaxID=2305227 RepID=UPI001008A247|nr:PolC-type DNA polymerase III [Longirhabdus pacifica]